jgi:transposase-like protein
LKELMLGKREEAVTKLLEQVFNSVLQAQATEQLNAEPYERSDERTTYRNGSRTRMQEPLDHAIHLLNNRPRKCLNWKTPYPASAEELLHLV